MKGLILFIVAVFTLFYFGGCTKEETITKYLHDTTEVEVTVRDTDSVEVEVTVRDTDTVEVEATYNTPKYIFFFIGDGMATPQINGAEAALGVTGFGPSAKSLADVTMGSYNMSDFPVSGMSTTHAQDRYITGSAASATALATGNKTTIGTISKNGDHTSNYTTMAEMAKAKGMKVGIVSSVSIDHATPACFYAHQDSRSSYYDIAAQMATSGFNYFAGGYAKGNFASKRGSNPNIEDIMSDSGYTICTNRSQLQSATGNKVWAYTVYDGDGALNYELDRQTSEVSLAEFTEKGIELLDNENGFFLMVEGGKIDWACHANDFVSATYDMIAFDNAIGEAIDFYNDHPESTLIVVTGDHECGGLTLGFAATEYETAFELLKDQNVSYQLFTEKVENWIGLSSPDSLTFNDVLDSVKYYFGLGDTTIDTSLKLSSHDSVRLQDAYNKSWAGESNFTDTEVYLMYGPYYDPLTVTATHLLNQKAGLDWTSYYHTGVPVPVLAKGQGQKEFTGYYDNTDIAKKIIEIADLD